jgi:hypothetical protein
MVAMAFHTRLLALQFIMAAAAEAVERAASLGHKALVDLAVVVTAET